MNLDIIGRRRIWLLLSSALIALSVLAAIVRPLDLSIDFVGGTSFIIDQLDEGVTIEDLEAAAEGAGAANVRVQLVEQGGTAAGARVETEVIAAGTPQERRVTRALRQVSGAESVDVDFVGPRWGERISRKMLQALAVFLIVIVLYISLRLEFKMAVAALVALVHDVVITGGLYALIGFEVSPATVIALLTILGYSLYDTVVVFDRVKERTVTLGGPGRRTYSEAVNTSLNEVLWRSLNTSLMALLPVGALLFIGSTAIGADTLKDLSLALFIGIAVGTYSSLFVATPFLAWWKEREPKYAALADRVRKRDETGVRPQPPTRVSTRQKGLPTAEVDTGGGTQPTERPRTTSPRTAATTRPPGYVRGPGRKPRRKR